MATVRPSPTNSGGGARRLRLASAASALLFALGSYALPAPVQGTSSSSALTEITLSRHGCYGACPSDSVTIQKSGAVEYLGFAHVPKLGRYRGHVTAATYARIVSMTTRARFFALTSAFGKPPEEAATYDITASRGGDPVRVYVNDRAAAPAPLRDLAGLLSQVRDATALTSTSPINAVVGQFYALPSPDREIYVDIATDDETAGDRSYVMSFHQRVAQPCNAGEPKSEDSPSSDVVVDAAGVASGDGYEIRPTSGGVRITNARETIDLKRVEFSQAPDEALHAAATTNCPVTLELQNNGDVTDARPTFVIVSNVPLDVPSVISHAHFRCDSKTNLSIGVVQRDWSPAGQHEELAIAPMRDLMVNTPCRLIIDAGVSSKASASSAPAAESVTFYYIPQH